MNAESLDKLDRRPVGTGSRERIAPSEPRGLATALAAKDESPLYAAVIVVRALGQGCERERGLVDPPDHL